MVNNKQLIKDVIIYLSLVALFFLLIIWYNSSKGYDYSLVRWDSIEYQKIALKGFVYLDNYGTNVSFFPGYPFLLKLFNGNLLVSIFINGLLFLSAYLVLVNKGIIKHSLLALSVPSACFFFLPYPESLFFFGIAIFFIGLQSSKNLWIFTGLLLASFTKTASTFIIITLIAMILVYPKSYKKFLWGVLASSISWFGAAYIQYLDTGKWFAFLGQQKYWGHKLQLPKLPFSTWLTNWEQSATPWMNAYHIDSLAVSFALLMFVFIASKGYQILQKKQALSLKEAEVFSLLMLLWLSLFAFGYKGGSFFSFNRYILATPFFFLVYPMLKEFVSTKQQKIYLLIGLIIIQMAFGYYFRLSVALYGIAYALLLSLYFTEQNGKYKALTHNLLFIVFAFYQAWFIHLWLIGGWVG